MIPGTGGPQILSEIEVMRKEIEVLRQRRLQRAREELRSATASPLRTAPADELRQQMQELSEALESAGDLGAPSSRRVRCLAGGTPESVGY